MYVCMYVCYFNYMYAVPEAMGVLETELRLLEEQLIRFCSSPFAGIFSVVTVLWFLFVYLFAQDAHMRGTKNGTCTE